MSKEAAPSDFLAFPPSHQPTFLRPDSLAGPPLILSNLDARSFVCQHGRHERSQER